MIYDQYTNRIKNILSDSRKRKDLQKGILNEMSGTQLSMKEKFQEQRNFGASIHLSAIKPLQDILNPALLQNATLGHPDFKHLKGTDNIEQHYIVSAFMDIAGSTNLFRSYDLEDNYLITNTIQIAALHTCIAVGGHVQRLQGDGVFAYFGGKYISKQKAAEMAVTACSMFTYFVANDLKNIFLGDEIENIKTRIGIDFGDDKDVLWANFGVMDVSELTTLSLHTSLAHKMVSSAKQNGIVVGDNMKTQLKADDAFFSLVTNSKGEVDRYIFQDRAKNFNYTQYAFNWYNYLKSLSFIGSDADGKLYIIDPEAAERERIAKLMKSVSLINSGNAFTTPTGSVSIEGVQNQPHRFHYEK